MAIGQTMLDDSNGYQLASHFGFSLGKKIKTIQKTLNLVNWEESFKKKTGEAIKKFKSVSKPCNDEQSWFLKLDSDFSDLSWIFYTNSILILIDIKVMNRQKCEASPNKSFIWKKV
jgi:hypothetical protein